VIAIFGLFLSLLWPGGVEARASELVLTCGWCGTSCQASTTADVLCQDLAHPEGQVCVAENGVCVIKDGEGLILDPTPETWARPSRTISPRVSISPGVTIDPVVLSCKTCNGKYAFKLGNANCDDKVDLLDFGMWKQDYVAGTNDLADFNCDGIVDLMDFGIWKASYIAGDNLPTQVPTEAPTAVPTMAPTRQPIGTVVPIATPSPSDSTSNLTCKWCDNGCGSYPDSKVCLTVEPPEGKKCDVVEGDCKMIDEKDIEVTPKIEPVVTIFAKPTFSRDPPPVDPVM